MDGLGRGKLTEVNCERKYYDNNDNRRKVYILIIQNIYNVKFIKCYILHLKI